MIKSRVKQYYDIFQNEKYNENIEQLQKVEKPILRKSSIKEGKLVKKIRKSAMIKRLQNFWKSQTQ